MLTCCAQPCKTVGAFMYEPRPHPLAPFRLFVGRYVRHTLIAGVIVLVALAIGIMGYHWFARFTWLDSLLNASMILTGMGPVGELNGTVAKLWASAYALFSGLIFVTSMGIVGAPVVHRLLHKFHLEDSK
jgi:hypothetical protein